MKKLLLAISLTLVSASVISLTISNTAVACGECGGTHNDNDKDKPDNKN